MVEPRSSTHRRLSRADPTSSGAELVRTRSSNVPDPKPYSGDIGLSCVYRLHQGTLWASAVLSHVTVPDGAVFKPGESFVKTWKIKNAGAAAWTTGYALVPVRGDKMGAPEGLWDYIYEPDAKAVIDQVLTRYIEALIYQSVSENIASEQSARMVAMKAASDNAGNVIGELQLIYNKSRQAAITKELSEIVGGAAAV